MGTINDPNTDLGHAADFSSPITGRIRKLVDENTGGGDISAYNNADSTLNGLLDNAAVLYNVPKTSSGFKTLEEFIMPKPGDSYQSYNQRLSQSIIPELTQRAQTASIGLSGGQPLKVPAVTNPHLLSSGPQIYQIQAPDGSIHSVYASKLHTALARYPGTKVLNNG